MTRPSQDERRHRRRLLNAPAAGAADGRLLFPCSIVDVSECGASLNVGDHNQAPDRFQLIDIDAGRAFSVRVVWRKGKSVGVAFMHERAVDDVDTPEWLTALWRELKLKTGGERRSAAA